MKKLLYSELKQQHSWELDSFQPAIVGSIRTRLTLDTNNGVAILTNLERKEFTGHQCADRMAE